MSDEKIKVVSGVEAMPLRKDDSDVIRGGLTEEQIGVAKLEPEKKGVDKLIAMFGFEPKHKVPIICVLALIIGGFYFLVVEKRSAGLESAPSSMTELKGNMGKVVIVDPDLIVRASVAQTIGGGKSVDSELLVKTIKETVKEHEDAGFIVIDKKMVFASPSYIDLTEIIAEKVGLDLKFADNLPVDEFKPMPPIEGVETSEAEVDAFFAGDGQ